MKPLLVVVVFALLVACVVARRSPKGPGKNKKCNYYRDEWGECDPATRKQNRTLKLVPGGPADCPQQKTKFRKCKPEGGSRCQYSSGEWSECDPVTKRKTRIMRLTEGDATECKAAKIKTRSCKSKQGKMVTRGNCTYVSGGWSKCDPGTRKMTKTLTLKPGQPSTCEATKTIERACRKRSRKHKRSKKCRYMKFGKWSACDPATKTKTRTLKLKDDEPESCPKTATKTKPCRPRSGKGRKGKNRGSKPCKYNKAAWGPCDLTTMTKSRTRTLRKGVPTCEASITQTKNCKKAGGGGKGKKCRYESGEWTPCDQTTGIKTRTDSLKPESPPSCNATRTMTRQCKKNKQQSDGLCKYDRGVWGECDEETMKRSIVLTLKPDQPESCERTRTETRPCFTKKGEEKCFFGPWGDFGPCRNGVKTKTRRLIAGGEKCERKTAKNNHCNN